MEPLPYDLSFEKGLFVVVRAIQLLTASQPGRVVVVGLAGPSGAGKSEFARRLRELTPLTLLPLVSFLDTHGQDLTANFDDPRLTDFGALTECIHALKQRRATNLPGSTPLRLGSTGVVLVEGIYALHHRVRPHLDLSVAISGGVHFDLLKRLTRDLSRTDQSPQEIIALVSETVFPMWKIHGEQDCTNASIRIRNSFNPFAAFLDTAFFTLKSTAHVPCDAVRAYLTQLGDGRCEEAQEATANLYLMPPGEDAETCRDWVRLRLRDGKYSLLFEEYISDGPLLISPSLSFDVPVRTLSGLMALGYSLGAVIRRETQLFRGDGVVVKYDVIEQLGSGSRFIQVEGTDRVTVEAAGVALNLGPGAVPKSYIELVQVGRLLSECPPLLSEFLGSTGDLASLERGATCAVNQAPPSPPPLLLSRHPPASDVTTSPGGTRLHTRPPLVVGCAAARTPLCEEAPSTIEGPAGGSSAGARRLLRLGGSFLSSEERSPGVGCAPAGGGMGALEGKVARLEACVAGLLAGCDAPALCTEDAAAALSAAEGSWALAAAAVAGLAAGVLATAALAQLRRW